MASAGQNTHGDSGTRGLRNTGTPEHGDSGTRGLRNTGTPASVFTWFVSLVVLLLYLASALKFASFFSSTVDVASVPPSFQLLGIGFDLIAAALILRVEGLRSRLNLICLTFGILGLASVYLYSAGYTSCGCGGVISLDPLYVSVFDFLIVALAVTMVIYSRASAKRHAVPIEYCGRHLSPTLTSFSLGAGLFYISIGLYYVLFPYIAPGPLEISTNINFGSRRLADGVFEVTFPIRNIGVGDVQIIGVSSTCRCIGVLFERKKIAPNGQDSLVVRVYPQRTGRFAQALVVYTNHPRQLRIPVLVRGSFFGEESK
jgi:hypothetical protein